MGPSEEDKGNECERGWEAGLDLKGVDVIFLSREGRDLAVAFQAPPGSQASSRGVEKEMATRSSILAWRIPGTGKPGGLPSMGSHRVGHEA